jgi:hypothetical protein
MLNSIGDSFASNYPFEETCYNYCCSLAIDMWVAQKREVITSAISYCYQNNSQLIKATLDDEENAMQDQEF